MRTFIIGRSPDADIVLADESVARQHAELVVTDDGRYHLTDCGGGDEDEDGGGTWRSLARRGGEDVWERTRQSFVAASQPLRFGQCRTTAREMLAARSQSAEAQASEGEPGAAAGRRGGAAPGGLSGPVERDPRTGEIVRRRI